MKEIKVDNISEVIKLAAQDRDYEYCLMLMTLEKIRKKYDSYIWVYPITYHDDKGKVYKQTFGWDIEFVDNTIKQYSNELPNYHDALKEAIESFYRFLNSEPEDKPSLATTAK